jgi:hypothetical protein
MYALVAALLSMLRPMSGYAWIRRNPPRVQGLLRGLATRESILTTQQPAAVKLAKQCRAHRIEITSGVAGTLGAMGTTGGQAPIG